MAVGAGARPHNLLWLGLILMLCSCAVIATTGQLVLGWMGY